MSDVDEHVEKVIKEVVEHLIRKKYRPKERRRARALRKYGSDIAAIIAVYPFDKGVVILLDKEPGSKELEISLIDKVPNFELLLRKKKLKILFHEEELVVDIYTKADGIIYKLDLMEYLFDELL